MDARRDTDGSPRVSAATLTRTSDRELNAFMVARGV